MAHESPEELLGTWAAETVEQPRATDIMIQIDVSQERKLQEHEGDIIDLRRRTTRLENELVKMWKQLQQLKK